jgi:hypothetical protein
MNRKLKTRPLKTLDLLTVIRRCIRDGKYLSCLHLEEREIKREITRKEVLYVLEHGYHEKIKDSFDEGYQVWHYAIRGKTLDERDLRVFVSFDAMTQLVIITTYEVEK